MRDGCSFLLLADVPSRCWLMFLSAGGYRWRSTLLPWSRRSCGRVSVSPCPSVQRATNSSRQDLLLSKSNRHHHDSVHHDLIDITMTQCTMT
eukprot:1161711-Pelagomonas_calceolata.AAC.2